MPSCQRKPRWQEGIVVNRYVYGSYEHTRYG
jgi:hypothetical protein